MSATVTEQTKQKRPPGRPKKPAPVPITETDEFKAAVAQAARTAAANILSQLKVAQEGTSKPGDATWAEGLAMAIAQLTHQGVGKAKPVDPKVLAARDEARVRMTNLLIEARAKGELPTYYLRNKVYLGERLIDPVYIDPASKEQRNTEIGWPHVPNEAMVPVNEVAIAIHAAFSDSIGVVQIDKSKHIKPEHLAVTHGGLVIKGGSLATMPIKEVGQGAPGDDGLQITRGRGVTGGKSQQTIHVLGTVAPPARVGQ